MPSENRVLSCVVVASIRVESWGSRAVAARLQKRWYFSAVLGNDVAWVEKFRRRIIASGKTGTLSESNSKGNRFVSLFSPHFPNSVWDQVVEFLSLPLSLPFPL